MKVKHALSLSLSFSLTFLAKLAGVFYLMLNLLTGISALMISWLTGISSLMIGWLTDTSSHAELAHCLASLLLSLAQPAPRFILFLLLSRLADQSKLVFLSGSVAITCTTKFIDQ